jgi:hypothetical protein
MQNISNLPVGAKVKFGRYQVNTESAVEIIWRIVAKNHVCTPAYPSNSVTLLTDKIIDLRAIDAKEPSNSNTDRQQYGNNRYSQSNMDQWLNKSSAAGAWYVAAHAADASPDTSSSVRDYNTPYAAKTGFLNLFTADELNSILLTTIRVVKNTVTDGGSYENIQRKLFFPSVTEIGLANENSIAEGAKWEGFSDNASRISNLTQQAFTNSLSTSKPAAVADAYFWLLRTPSSAHAAYFRCVSKTGTSSTTYAASGGEGVRPALNISSTAQVTDTTDADGCYVVAYNVAPTAPGTITTPSNIYGGQTANISWGAGSDADGNLAGYELERSYNGGAFAQIYKGSALTFQDTITAGWTSVQYRVRSYDTLNAVSGYTTGESKTVINNTVPTISGTDSNLGTKTDGFTQTYTVTDPDVGASATIVEKIDDTVIRTYAATLGAENAFNITGETWLKILNGLHTIVIEATDNLGAVAVRTYTFTKNITTLSIRPTAPMQATTQPTRISISVVRSIPAGAVFEVLVCNNANDTSPTWEDATQAVIDGLVYVFTNASKTATDWAVDLQINVDRNGASGACYVSAVDVHFDGGTSDLSDTVDLSTLPDLAEDVNDAHTDAVGTVFDNLKARLDNSDTKKANKILEDWIIPTFTNAWINDTSISGTGGTTGYYKDNFGVVHFKGTISGGAVSTVVFILPVGYRPAQFMFFMCASSGAAHARVEIRKTGEVVINSFSSWVDLSSISFRV